MNTHSIDLEAGSSQYLLITDANQTGLDIVGDLTLECWVKFESDTTTYLLNKWGVGGDLAYALTYTSGGTGLRLRINDGVDTTDKTVAWTPSLDTWYHIAVSYDASVGECKFYVNGSQQGATQTGLNNSINNNSEPFAIGVNYNGGSIGTPHDGKIDDIRVWNDIRTQTEIDDNKSLELVGDESGLVAYWKFNNSLLDETSNDNDLTAVNSPVFSTDIPFIGEISITKSLKYTILNTPTAKTKSLKYTVFSGQAIQKSLKYTVKSTPSAKTKSLDYSVITQTQIQKSLKYEVESQVAINKSLKYTVTITPTQITKSLEYQILVETPIQKSLQYEVITDTNIQKSLHYEVLSNVAIQKSLKYTILNTPTAIQKSLEYQIETTPSAITKSLEYDIVTETNIQKSLHYEVESQVAIQKSLKYTIERTPSALTKSLQYEILTSDSISKGLIYKILDQKLIQKSLSYCLAIESIDIQKSLKYTVIKDNLIQKGLIYNIVTEATPITKSLQYVVEGQVQITKSLQYEVRSFPYGYGEKDAYKPFY